MKMFKTMLMAAFAMVVTLGLAGSASAATIACGDCHGATTKTPAYESHPLPTDADNCAGDARGLHGVHNNYSSASYGMTFGARGNCSYCHTSSGGGHPTATHDNGYINVTSTTAAPGLAYDQGTSTCTNACHKNTGATAKWGNYTSTATIKLTCTSCHSDATNGGTGLSSPGTAPYGHNIHLNGSWLGTGATKARIVLGSYSGYLNSGDNSACLFCHPDNRNDFWSQGRADDGSKKAYPHASDGTNVMSKNAAVDGLAGVVLSNWTGLYVAPMCTASCHVQQSSYQQGYAKWDGTKPTTSFSNCEICHQHKASYAINLSSNVPLTYAHAIHFANLSTASGLIACNTCHGSVHTNYLGASQITRLPVTPGLAGINAAMNWSKTGTAAVDGTCQNTCHITASPAWNTIATNDINSITGCATCHEYPDGNNTWAAGNGHTVQYDTTVNPRTHLGLATTYNKTSDTYATVTSDASKCGKCHSGAAHRDGTANVAGSGFNNCGVGDFTVNVNTAGSDVTCSSVSCHSGKTTPNWW